MNIRLANHDDICAVGSLFSEFFAYNAAQQPENYISADENGNYPKAVIDGGMGDIIIAETEGAIVGLLHVEEASTPPYPSVRPHKFACIVDFIVSQPHRNKGVGKLLLEECKSWAQARNLAYLELMVLENNDIGRSFYEKEQFAAVSRTMRLDIQE